MVEDLVRDTWTVNECFGYQREYERLENLTQSKCSSTPRHIANFQHDHANPWVKSGFLCFVAMTKVPGTEVSKNWEYEAKTAEKWHEQTGSVQGSTAVGTIFLSKYGNKASTEQNNSLKGLDLLIPAIMVSG